MLMLKCSFIFHSYIDNPFIIAATVNYLQTSTTYNTVTSYLCLTLSLDLHWPWQLTFLNPWSTVTLTIWPLFDPESTLTLTISLCWPLILQWPWKFDLCFTLNQHWPWQTAGSGCPGPCGCSLCPPGWGWSPSVTSLPWCWSPVTSSSFLSPHLPCPNHIR